MTKVGDYHKYNSNQIEMNMLMWQWVMLNLCVWDITYSRAFFCLRVPRFTQLPTSQCLVISSHVTLNWESLVVESMILISSLRELIVAVNHWRLGNTYKNDRYSYHEIESNHLKTNYYIYIKINLEIQDNILEIHRKNHIPCYWVWKHLLVSHKLFTQKPCYHRCGITRLPNPLFSKTPLLRLHELPTMLLIPMTLSMVCVISPL